MKASTYVSNIFAVRLGYKQGMVKQANALMELLGYSGDTEETAPKGDLLYLHISQDEPDKTSRIVLREQPQFSYLNSGEIVVHTQAPHALLDEIRDYCNQHDIDIEYTKDDNNNIRIRIPSVLNFTLELVPVILILFG